MGELFGTDGIRGVANQYPLDCQTIVNVGRAIAAFFSGNDTDGASRFVIGQDTRISGDMLVGAIAAGICSMGKDVYLTGVMPTPGIAHLTAADQFAAGVVISASHNPYHDNGIKLFARNGYKLSDDDEHSIEELIRDDRSLYQKSQHVEHVGRILHLGNAKSRYRQFLKNCLANGTSLAGIKLCIDCSNGAASEIAPQLFETLGATVKILACQPDGININADCGSQHPELLAKTVIAEKADVGLAFDGDADRLIAVDESGAVLSGDQVMAILARDMLAKGVLTCPLVVTTVMSNMGLQTALKEMGLGHIKTQVGDRYVMEAMRKANAVLGGEDSGHMIFLNHHTTGDGMLAGLKLLEAMLTSDKPLSRLAAVMPVFPQCLINVDVKSKPPINTIGAIRQSIEAAEIQLRDRGRVLVRYSGTQPQCRVMVEGPIEAETNALCEKIAAVVAHALG